MLAESPAEKDASRDLFVFVGLIGLTAPLPTRTSQCPKEIGVTGRRVFPETSFYLSKLPCAVVFNSLHMFSNAMPRAEK